MPWLPPTATMEVAALAQDRSKSNTAAAAERRGREPNRRGQLRRSGKVGPRYRETREKGAGEGLRK